MSTLEAIAADLVEKTKYKRQLKAELTNTEATIQALEEQVLSIMEQAEVDRITVSGYTVSPRVEHWPKRLSDRAAAVVALRQTGFEDLILETFNYQSLRGRVSEMIRNGEPLPVEWEGAIAVETRHRCGVRRARQ